MVFTLWKWSGHQLWVAVWLSNIQEGSRIGQYERLNYDAVHMKASLCDLKEDLELGELFGVSLGKKRGAMSPCTLLDTWTWSVLGRRCNFDQGSCLQQSLPSKMADNYRSLSNSFLITWGTIPLLPKKLQIGLGVQWEWAQHTPGHVFLFLTCSYLACDLV